MGTRPSKLSHLLHHQKYSKKNSPQLNLKKNKLIVLKRAVAGASTASKWRSNKAGSTIELMDEIEQNEFKQNEENIELEERNNLEEGKEILLYSNINDLNEINSVKKEKYHKHFVHQQRKTTLAELAQMQKEMDKALNALKAKLEKLEEEQRRKINICATKWVIEVLKNSAKIDDLKTMVTEKENQTSIKRRRKLQTITEECRLRSALLTDKFKNCTEYLRGFEALISTIQREQQCNVEDDDFLREFLLETAKKQYRKGQLNQVVDTFCQLLIATDGHLRVEEMTLLVDVFREKVEQTRRFHERISCVIRQQMNDSPYVMDELWGFVLEELRVDCAEAFEIVMVTRGTNVCCEETGEEERQKVEKLKYFLGSIICALWLQITPYGHDEFEQVKELFLNTLERYYVISTREMVKNGQKLIIDKNELELKKSVKAVLRQYPMLGYTKKLQKYIKMFGD
ncbi:hypothetical protein ACQ4LE_001167 [Meloidogyne hapla]